MCNIGVLRRVLELHMVKEKKESRSTKLKLSCLVFSMMEKGFGMYGVDLITEKQRDVVCRLCAFLCFVF